MNKNETLANKIKSILLEESSSSNERERIITNIEYDLKSSERIISEFSKLNIKIASNKKSDDYDYVISEIEKFENKNKVTMYHIEYIISSYVDSGIGYIRAFDKLKHNYYKILNDVLNYKSAILQKNIKVVESKLNKFEEKSNSIEEKLEGIGSTILSTIVSLTVVVTAITAIDKIEEYLIPLYLVSMVWLCMTLIIFINNLFNKNDFNSKQATFLYFIVSIAELILLFPTLQILFG